MSNSRLKDLLNLSNVPRWSTVPLFRPQSVAEHSFRVAVIVTELRRLIDSAPAYTIMETPAIEWALIHDGAEAESGDVIGPWKHQFDPAIWSSLENIACPWLGREKSRLKTNDEMLVKIADKLEEWIYLCEWVPYNVHTNEVRGRTWGYIAQLVREAKSRFAWTNLPDAVHQLLSQTNAFVTWEGRSVLEMLESEPWAQRKQQPEPSTLPQSQQ